MSNNLEALKRQHLYGLSGLLRTYSMSNFIRGFRISLPISIVIFCTFICSDSTKKSFDLLNDLNSLSLSILPNLLGFMLGGYAILISFGNTEILKELTEFKEKGSSLYQNLSSTFAFCLLIQGFGLLFYASLLFIMKLEIRNIYFDYINRVVIFFSLLILFYSICAVIDVIINVFSFSQFHHYRLLNEKNKDTLISKRDANDTGAGSEIGKTKRRSKK